MRSHIGSSAAGDGSASLGVDRPDEIIMSAMLTYFGLFVTQNGLSAKGSFSPARKDRRHCARPPKRVVIDRTYRDLADDAKPASHRGAVTWVRRIRGL